MNFIAQIFGNVCGLFITDFIVKKIFHRNLLNWDFF